jgi:hypothetical protein
VRGCGFDRGGAAVKTSIDWSKTAAEIDAEFAAMAQEIKRLRADAERYRWLRDAPKNFAVIVSGASVEHGDRLNAAIDAARSKT